MKKSFELLVLILFLVFGFEFSANNFDSNIIFESIDFGFSILNFEIEPENDFEISNQNTNFETCNSFEICDTIVLDEEKIEIENENHTDHYNVDCDRWEEDDGSPIPEDIIDMNDRYDWEIENGHITDAREQYCIECHAWAKYHYCPVCGNLIW